MQGNLHTSRLLQSQNGTTRPQNFNYNINQQNNQSQLVVINSQVQRGQVVSRYNNTTGLAYPQNVSTAGRIGSVQNQNQLVNGVHQHTIQIASNNAVLQQVSEANLNRQVNPNATHYLVQNPPRPITIRPPNGVNITNPRFRNNLTIRQNRPDRNLVANEKTLLVSPNIKDGRQFNNVKLSPTNRNVKSENVFSPRGSDLGKIIVKSEAKDSGGMESSTKDNEIDQLTPEEQTTILKLKNFAKKLVNNVHREHHQNNPEKVTRIKELLAKLFQREIDPQNFINNTSIILNSEPSKFAKVLPFLTDGLLLMKKELDIKNRIKQEQASNRNIPDVILRDDGVNYSNRIDPRMESNRPIEPKGTSIQKLPGYTESIKQSPEPKIRKQHMINPRVIHTQSPKTMSFNKPYHNPMHITHINARSNLDYHNHDKFINRQYHQNTSFQSSIPVQDDDENDPLDLAGVNIETETSHLLHLSSNISTTQLPSCTERSILNLEALKIRTAYNTRNVPTANVNLPSQEAFDRSKGHSYCAESSKDSNFKRKSLKIEGGALAALASGLESMLKDEVTKIILVAKHRTQSKNVFGKDGKYREIDNVKKQLEFVNDIESAEKLREKDHQREEILSHLKRKKNSDPDNELQRERAKLFTDNEDARIKSREMHETAADIFSNRQGKGGKKFASSRSKTKIKATNVTIRDALFVLEDDCNISPDFLDKCYCSSSGPH